jgi:hypothetical protein
MSLVKVMPPPLLLTVRAPVVYRVPVLAAPKVIVPAPPVTSAPRFVSPIASIVMIPLPVDRVDTEALIARAAPESMSIFPPPVASTAPPRVTAPVWFIVILPVPEAVIVPAATLVKADAVPVPVKVIVPSPPVTAALRLVPASEFTAIVPLPVDRVDTEALIATVEPVAEAVMATLPPPEASKAPPRITAPVWSIVILPVPDAVIVPVATLVKADVVPEPVDEKALPEAAITLTGPEMLTSPGVGVFGVMIKVAASTEAAPVTLTPPPARVTSTASSGAAVEPVAAFKVTMPAGTAPAVSVRLFAPVPVLLTGPRLMKPFMDSSVAVVAVVPGSVSV